ncbi:ferric reductase NAD binding domain-containing protein [Kickxella alabastrina]|uniref:ferric reductase NAD binding domain-containing protein n=1 Tax=Kickxella alabastrina TaxID=61397 RepID=UPI00222005C9|nr:ferric reductase NAD binding domain-containing protein [Kickxella alabastrina]KAI7825420.1 ferric reductase NAD binding domain-containing protein [Kickxella alabastrina]
MLDLKNSTYSDVRPRQRTLLHRLELWMINDGKMYLYLGFWILIQSLLYSLAAVNYRYYPLWQNMHELLGGSFIAARSAALVLHVNTALVLLPICRTVISWIRTTPLNRVIPFDHALLFHKLVGYSILLFTLVHAGAHYRNYYVVSQVTGVPYWRILFTTGHSITGHLMMFCMIIMGVTGYVKIRQKHFNLFWNLHHLYVLYFACFSIHGGFCLLKSNLPPFCSTGAAFWKYWVASGKVILHPGKVIEAGQYAFLCCPAVSTQQWHPFTLTSAPEEDYVSVHVRVVGDWTKSFSEALGAKDEHWKALETANILPQVLVDGPFGSASEDVFNHEIAMLFCAGIGCTPFASVLKSIWYRLSYPEGSFRLRKVYFFWTQRDTKSFEWFQDLLKAIEEEDEARLEMDHDIGSYSLGRPSVGQDDSMIEIHTYLTGKLNFTQMTHIHLNVGDVDPITGLRSPTKFGRPNLDLIFRAVAHEHPATDVGVFFCGPHKMGSTIGSAAKKWSSKGQDGTKFYYNKENF